MSQRFIVDLTVSSTFNLPNLSKQREVVETYRNGTEWYCVYSDGWVEQGGIFQGGSTYKLTAYNFHKPFKDTNYFFIATINNLGHSWFTGTSGADMRSVTDIASSYGAGLKTSTSISIQGFSKHAWYACGQGLQQQSAKIYCIKY